MNFLPCAKTFVARTLSSGLDHSLSFALFRTSTCSFPFALSLSLCHFRCHLRTHSHTAVILRPSCSLAFSSFRIAFSLHFSLATMFIHAHTYTFSHFLAYARNRTLSHQSILISSHFKRSSRSLRFLYSLPRTYMCLEIVNNLYIVSLSRIMYVQ